VERQGFGAGGGVSAPSLDNVEEHSLSPFIRECIVRVVRVERCVRGPWGVSASGKERREGREEEPRSRARAVGRA
jgi:hypothetical protein